MKREGVLSHFVWAFLLALAGYMVFYTVIEHRRTAKGPWEVLFTITPQGKPAIVIDQHRLGITNVQVTFEVRAPEMPDDYAPVRFDFSQPRPVPFDAPFGRCVFMDTTFLPGTVTLDLFGHEIELLPRVLVVDRQEQPWRSGRQISLESAPGQRSSGSAPTESATIHAR